MSKEYKWNDVKINTRELPVLNIDNLDSLCKESYEFYMRRGNRYYFRNEFRKIVITSVTPLPVKLGRTVEIRKTVDENPDGTAVNQ